MSGHYHEIDPSGDVVLVLSAQRRAPVKTSSTEPTAQAKPASSTSPASTEADHHTPLKQDSGEKPSDPEEAAPAAVETPQTRFRVSSKHLTLASEYFKAHIKKRIAPTSTADEPGYDEVHMLDCDPEAFLIVMNIIHGKGQQIPNEVDVAMMLKVAAVVCYLDCEPACTFVLGVWIKRLLDAKKVVYDTWDNCLKWAYISWAFRQPSLFTSSTSAAMSWRCSSSKYPADLNLPVTIKGIVVLSFFLYPLLAPGSLESRSNALKVISANLQTRFR
ncbi:uncharacterized protein CDV56_107503 [Aspergillus thermomutatus]|uniref:Uncharacterized protein n=1 Tax=Aspergillus thermomutatus TaxID=41047 RepID=A0A397HGI0_ASPTH|nr:uncharacterized protein CDV56_107503 [Aspergillus thermomutatus]RHZ61148.1 hypothetical protein CDV56_107503 [Aspergillus thermomutatus]